jgi:hypothetical protein
MPARIDYEYRDDDLPALGVGLDIRYEPLVMRYVLHGLRFERDVHDMELTGTVLRTVTVHELLRSAASKARVKPLVEFAFEIQEAGSFVPNEPAKLVAQGPSEETLNAIARHYRVAEVIGIRPALYLQGILAIPYPTVSNWIARAKKAGHFPDSASLAADQEILKARFPDQFREGLELLKVTDDWGTH